MVRNPENGQITGPRERLGNRIRAARGEIAADLVLRGGRIVNVFTGRILDADLAVYDGTIVGLGNGYRGEEEVRVRGRFLVPGMIDGHIHIESTMMLPSGLAAAVLPRGTTAIIADPHEIANVLGIEGIRLMLEHSARLPLDIFFMAPSCVPATHLETAGARLTAGDLARLKNEPGILGLAEVMNFPGLLAGDPDLIDKILVFEDAVLDGHAPGLRGKDLQAYLVAGIRSDHETSDYHEGLEKLESGMFLMIRQGSAAENLEALLPLVNADTLRRCCLVSDDLHPRDLRQKGHLNYILKRAVELGIDPVSAIRMVTINPAEYFGLKRKGALAPGYDADIAVLDDLHGFEAHLVYKNGRLAARQGRPVQGISRPAGGRPVSGPLNIAPFSMERLRIPGEGERDVRVIELIPGQILTGSGRARLKARDGAFLPEISSDIIKLLVVERHRGTGRIGMGFVKGFGLRTGAIGSSVAHDSHNVIAAGVDDLDLFLVIQEIKSMGGGIAVAGNGKIRASVRLEVAGLMTGDSLEDLADGLEAAVGAASDLGCILSDPFATLSFLALPVIPELKLTDKGLVDVRSFSHVPLFI